MSNKVNSSVVYTESRNPSPEKDGRYAYHPKVVRIVKQDKNDTLSRIETNQLVSKPHMISALSALEKYIIEEMSAGNEVVIGDLFTIRPKIKLKSHQDENGKKSPRKYYEGDKIQANDVVFAGLDIQPTKALLDQLSDRIQTFCHTAANYRPASNIESAQFKAEFEAYLNTHSTITRNAIKIDFSLTDYQSRKLLAEYSSGKNAILTQEKVGKAYIYKKR